MKKSFAIAGLAGAMLVALPQAALAQSGEEIRGHPVQVAFADGTVNTVNFNADGSATITSATGRQVQGAWGVEMGRLCLQSAAGRECWAYNAPFQANMPVTLTSECGTSSWTALSTNMPPPSGQRGGERGR